MNLLWSLQILSCFYMAGIIALIQGVHYPSFLSVETRSFVAFHHRHSSRMLILVGPMMVVELLSTLLIFILQGGMVNLLSLVSVLILWGATFFVSVPLHDKLAKGADPVLIAKLIRTNWVRFFLWFARAVFLFVVLLRFMGGQNG